MRRLLLAFALAGAVSHVSAQERLPDWGETVTYSEAARAIVQALRNMPEGLLWQIADRYNYSGSGFNRSISVSWNYTVGGQQATYNGTLNFNTGSSIWGYIDSFYNAVCQTQRQQDCGRFGTGATGTSLDRYKTGQGPFIINPTWFPSGPGPAFNEGVTIPVHDQYWCLTAEGDGYGYQFVRHEYEVPGTQEAGTNWIAARRTYSGGVPGDWSFETRFRQSGDEAVQWAANNTSAECYATYPRNRFVWFIEGRTRRWMGQETVNTDALHAIGYILGEYVAEVDRLRVEDGGEVFELPAGFTLSPTPEPAAVMPDEGALDPGTCEDGWFLTKVVCEIRTQGERLWTFISHDAWTPTVSWESRIEGLRSAANERIPFGLISGSGSGAHISFLDETLVGESAIDRWLQREFDPQYDCPDWNIDVSDWFPLGVHVEHEDVRVSLCESPFMEWLHETGRDWLHAFLIAGITIWMVQSVVGVIRGH